MAGATQRNSQGSRGSLVASLLTAPVIALGTLVNLLGCAALAFPEVLSSHLSVIIGTLLAGSVFATLFGALRASLDGTLMEMQEAPGMVMGLMGVAIYAALPSELPESERVATIIAMYAVTTMLTGAFFYSLGAARLGDLIRYIPFPVIGGVLAGLGLLMMSGALSVVTGMGVSFETFGMFLTGEMVARWLPAAALGLAISICVRRFKHFLTIPILLLLATAGFYVVAWLTSTSFATLEADGWLLGPFPDGSLFHRVEFARLAEVDPGVLLSMLPEVASVVLISTIGILLHASGLELAAREEVDLDRELRVCGVGNLGAGFFGGVPIFHSLSTTLLMRQMNATSLMVPAIVVAFWLFVLFAGGGALGYFPRLVLAGLLLYMGGELLWEWLVQGKQRLPFGDWFVIVIIVLAVAFVGYMEGIALGVFAGIILFQIGYTKIDVIKHRLRGDTFRSNVERNDKETQALTEHGSRILCLQLQGFIFFGTANRIVVAVRDELEQQTGIDWLVLDFRQVGGLDWAAVNSFMKLIQLAERYDVRLVLAVSDPSLRETLAKGEVFEESNVASAVSIDEAMEWCEESLLEALEVESALSTVDGLPGWIAEHFENAEERSRFMKNLDEVTFQAGDAVMRQGEPADSLLILMSGRASIFVEGGNGDRIRVRSYQAGSIVGEIGLYSGAARTATVTADSEIHALKLSREAFDRMRIEAPLVAGHLDELIVELLGRRLAGTNQLVASLMN